MWSGLRGKFLLVELSMTRRDGYFALSLADVNVTPDNAVRLRRGVYLGVYRSVERLERVSPAYRRISRDSGSHWPFRIREIIVSYRFRPRGFGPSTEVFFWREFFSQSIARVRCAERRRERAGGGEEEDQKARPFRIFANVSKQAQ